MLFRRGDSASLIRRRRDAAAIAALLLVALLLRVYQVNWDQGHLYHPDERFILMSAAAIHLTLPFSIDQLVGPNPTLIPRDYSYSYGTFALYLVRLVAAVLVGLSQVFPFLHVFDNLGDLGNLRLVGRPLSALFDTASVYLVYRLGRELYGRRVGFLAAGLLAFSVIDIQLSHFYATDTILTALTFAVVVASVEFVRAGKTSSIIWAGIFCGLALATKASSAVVLAPFVAAHLGRAFLVEDPTRGVRLRAPSGRMLGAAVEGLLLGAIFVGLAFVLAEPYALLDFNHFVGGILDQSQMVRGAVDLPYTRQYFGRPPYLYFLQNLALFGVGLPLGLAMLGGWLYVIVRNVLRPRIADLVILIYVVPYFAITGDFYAKFLRYMLPITPFLVLFAALGLVRLVDLTRGWYRSACDPAGTGESVRLSPDLVPEVDAAGFDLPDLARIDGEEPESRDRRSDRRPALSARADGPSRAASLPRPSPATNGVAALDPLTSSPDLFQPVHPTVDPEAERFARLKGMSLEWFTVDDSDLAMDAASSRSLVHDGRRPGVDWIEGASPERDGEVDNADSRPLPGWLAGLPSVVALFATPWPIRFARGLVAAIVAFTVFYGLAFDHMYAQLSPPVQASAWLYQHAPRGSVLATEHWEEGMPVPIVTASGVQDAGTQGYRNVTMPMYDDDNAQKLNVIVNNLEQADYIVFFSNRMYGTVTRMPVRYPMSRRYYEQLFGQKLGFTLVDVAERYPNLLGVAFVDNTLADPGLPVPPLIQNDHPAPITIDLGHADESFSVYDHQRVLIFKKTQKLTPDQLRALIGPPASPGQVASTVSVPHYKSLMLTSAQEAVVKAGGTFRDLFNRDDVLNRFPLPTWMILILLVGLGGFPFAFLTFRFLPDRGYLVSRTLGVLMFAWLSWIIVSLGLVEATRPATLAIFGIFLLLAAVAAYLQRDEVVAFVRARRRVLLAEEGVFWLAFLYDVWVRAQNPDLWHPVLGGEKPMDLAYLTAATRSPIYPPYDPWFAGGYMNYYYFGQIIVGTLTKVTGVLPTTSYNLAVPLLFALTVAGAFTAGYALTHRGDPTSERPAFLGGALAALMVCVLGNLGGFLQFVGEVYQQSSVQVPTGLPSLDGLLGFLSGAINILGGARPLVIPEDWYWSSTRMLALLDLKGTGSINEFPYFTFLFADLHAHLIALPFTLLVIAFCVNIVKSRGALAHLPEARLPSGQLGFAVETAFPAGDVRGETGSAISSWRARVAPSTIAALALAGLTVGALYPTNSWDYPTYLGLLGLSLAVPWWVSERRTLNGFVTLALRFLVIVVLSQVLFRPFAASFQSFYSGVHLIDEKSDPIWYFMIHGLFLVIMASYFILEGWSRYRRSAAVRAARLYLRDWELLPHALELRRSLARGEKTGPWVGWYALGALVIVVALAIVLGAPLIGGLIAVLAIALSFGFRRDRAPEDTLIVFLFATGLAIGIGTDLVAIDGDVGRMNTIFKFYEQVWVLFGVASAVALVTIVKRLAAMRRPVLRRAWLGVVVAFFLMASVYPILGTRARVANRFAPLPLTLDGTAYMDQARYNDDGKVIRLATDKAAMIWLEDHLQGTPTILEATRPLYRWGARMSIYTGLPTVIGWDWHQKQQRWGYQEQVDQRVSDVNRMYDDPSQRATLDLLHAYGVNYIIDGELEQGFHPTARAKFDSMVGSSLDLVYNQNDVRIYRVK